MIHLEDELAAYALGLCSTEDAHRIEEHVHTCTACASQLKEAIAVVERSAIGNTRPSDAWAPIAAQVDGPQRFALYAEHIAQMFDVSVAEARALLVTLDDAENWFDGPGENTFVKPVQAGPKLGEKLTSFVRIKPGASIPTHEHPGPETMFVLQGGFKEVGGDGGETWRGEACARQAGSSHELTALPGLDCLAAVVLDVG